MGWPDTVFTVYGSSNIFWNADLTGIVGVEIHGAFDPVERERERDRYI